MFKKTNGIFLGLAVLFLFPSIAPGQAVFLARKALGLISHITDQTHHHETASVLLEADANKVFAATEKIIGGKPENRILAKVFGRFFQIHQAEEFLKYSAFPLYSR